MNTADRQRPSFPRKRVAAAPIVKTRAVQRKQVPG